MKRTGSLVVLALALSATAASANPRRTVVLDSNNQPIGGMSLTDSSPHDILKLVPHNPEVAPLTPAGTADSRILFMNNCMPNGCKITSTPQQVGDNRTHGSDVATISGTLSAWKWGQPTWDATMACMRNVFSRFNVTLTDVDPGPNTAHYEVDVGGTATQIMGSNGNGVLGIADVACQAIGSCDPYIPHALVFAFADDSYYTQNTADEICATAAQEIAHTWSLDHVVDASDPMTYNSYNGIRQYKDNQKCGSDCQGGQSPFGLTCTGSGGQATHTCMLGGATQNEVSTILALFGPASQFPPPTVSITSPTANETVAPGFGVDVTCNPGTGDSIASVALSIDGSAVHTLTAAPFNFTAPSTLANGAHTVSVECTSTGGGTADAMVDVTQATGCHNPSDCPNSTDTCVAGACVPGMGAPGGLGTPCTNNAMCTSGSCASDGTNKYCVVSCDPAMQGCPTGFGCLAVGASGGVCWPGADNGGGSSGCTTGGKGGGEIVFGLGFAALLIARRRR